MVKQLKNRYNDLNMNKRFVVGVDRAKMRLYDCEQSAQMIFLTMVRKKSILMRKQNQRNHLRDSSFERLLFCFHPTGKKIADCGAERDATFLIHSRNQTWDGHYYTFNPHPGDIVDVY